MNWDERRPTELSASLSSSDRGLALWLTVWHRTLYPRHRFRLSMFQQIVVFRTRCRMGDEKLFSSALIFQQRGNLPLLSRYLPRGSAKSEVARISLQGRGRP
jgi:hypothetical protein